MQLIRIDPQDRRQVRRFLELPYHLYADIPQWVPPLRREERRMLDRRRHPFYRHSEAAFFLVAADGGEDLGRLAVLENRRLNAHWGTHTAFFYLFECVNDLQAATLLFEAAANWARERGLDELRGPRGFGPLDGKGLLVEGFAHRPALGITYNPPYYVDLIEALGFEPCGELVSGYVNRDSHYPESIHRLSERIQARRGLRVVTYRSRRELKALVARFAPLYNETLGYIEENYPLTQEELEESAGKLLSMADPHLIKLIQKGDELVGFLFAYPDVSAALQRCRGRLWPLGWLWLWRDFRRTLWVNINGIGILPQYQGLGGTAILYSEIIRSLLEDRFQHGEIVQIRVDNERMLRELHRIGVDIYKRHRLYRRQL